MDGWSVHLPLIMTVYPILSLNPISLFFVDALSILRMCKLKPASSQTGQQVDKKSKYQQLEWTHQPQGLMGSEANNWGTPMAQGFSNYTDHLKPGTKGTHTACVQVSVKIPLVNFHSEKLERRNRAGLPMQFLNVWVLCVCLRGAHKSTGLSLCWSVWPAAYAVSLCERACTHTRLLGISALSHHWLALGTQNGSSLTLTDLAGTGDMLLGPTALHIWLPLTTGMAKRTHTFSKFLSKAFSNTLKVKCTNLP